VRVVIGDDELLLREGLARLLSEAGVEVLATAGTPDDLVRRVGALRPDVAIVDIRMPPTHTDEGLRAADAIRSEHPEIAVLVLSHHVESVYAMRLLNDQPERCGYLLKERISDVAVLVDALQRVVDGESVVDPTIVSRLMRRKREASPLDELTEREREVLALIAEGRSNNGIAGELGLSAKTVEAHIRAVFMKLGLDESQAAHRRVLAVLTYLGRG
jgi:DNA-binding NarL/FixJ family response regulator